MDTFESDAEAFLIRGLLLSDNDAYKKEAAKYFKKSASLGNLTSILKYAKILKEGYGVKINMSEAARYYKMAADKGSIDGMRAYASMLYNGNGVEVNR